MPTLIREINSEIDNLIMYAIEQRKLWDIVVKEWPEIERERHTEQGRKNQC